MAARFVSVDRNTPMLLPPDLREREKKTGKKCRGKEPKRPDKKAEDSKEQCNLSDPDARIMRKNKRASFTQSYNAQAAVDAGSFDRLEQEGVEIYCSVHREDAHNERHYDFRPGRASKRAVKEPADDRLVAMRDKLRTEEGRAFYGRHNYTFEPVFGIIKAATGFRGLILRGKEKVAGEWTLVCLAYNLRRLHRMA